MLDHEVAIRTLLELDGQVIDQEDGYWVKIDGGGRSSGAEGQMKVIRIGIAPQERIRARVLAIAKGELKPKPSDPKVWFTSMRSLAEVLSDENRALLEVIRSSKPESITALADLTGRRQSNLSRTLKTMANYGLVELRRGARSVRPVVQAERFEIVAD